MCRYAGKHYKTRFACFACRKSFKKLPFEDFLRQQGQLEMYQELLRKEQIGQRRPERLAIVEEWEKKYQAAVGKCPQCGELMADVGWDFRPPKQSDVTAWSICRGMLRIGRRFQTCGCDGPGYVPRDRKAYVAYLQKMLAHYEQALYARPGVENSDLNPFGPDRIPYWTERVEAVRAGAAAGRRSRLRELAI